MTSPVQPPFVPGAGPRPFRSREDVLAQMPGILRLPAAAPIRDALIDALTVLVFQLELAGELAAAQSDPLRATLQYLDALGGEDRGIYRQDDELDPDYSSRVNSAPDVVTEAAILAGVNAILAPFTSTLAQLIDANLDGWFVNDGGGSFTWHSFIDATPSYHDRLYSGQEAENGGYSRPQSDPGGARVFADTIGRFFLLLAPDLQPVLLEAPFVFAGAENPDPDIGFYVGDGSNPDIEVYLHPSQTTALAVAQAIASFIDDVKGQGIRWSLLSELEAA